MKYQALALLKRERKYLIIRGVARNFKNMKPVVRISEIQPRHSISYKIASATSVCLKKAWMFG